MRGIAGEFDALDFAAESREAEIALYANYYRADYPVFRVVVGRRRSCALLSCACAIARAGRVARIGDEARIASRPEYSTNAMVFYTASKTLPGRDSRRSAMARLS